MRWISAASLVFILAMAFAISGSRLDESSCDRRAVSRTQKADLVEYLKSL